MAQHHGRRVSSDTTAGECPQTPQQASVLRHYGRRVTSPTSSRFVRLAARRETFDWVESGGVRVRVVVVEVSSLHSGQWSSSQDDASVGWWCRVSCVGDASHRPVVGRGTCVLLQRSLRSRPVTDDTRRVVTLVTRHTHDTSHTWHVTYTTRLWTQHLWQ